MSTPTPQGDPTSPASYPPRGLWAHLIGFFIDNQLVVSILVGLILLGSMVVAPFDIAPEGLPREPVPVDAIPDVGENQQIVFSEWQGRSPRDIEDQITYPLTTALLGIPGVRTVRSYSMFGFSTVYVIFEDDVEFYWSRSRVLEKLSALPANTLPASVTPMLGPDATALGQVFWYTLEGRDARGKVVGGWDLHELRAAQDWQVRYALQSVPGVSEVAGIGGQVQEYQIDVNPEALVAHGITLPEVARAVRESNLDVGARTLEINRVEYVVRGVGFIHTLKDIEEAVVTNRDNVPIRVKDVAVVGLGPANRRGVLDNGGAEAVGGVVVARFGENPLQVIDRVKLKLAEIAPGLPRKTLEDGTVSQITVVPFYDRTHLIRETLGTLSTALYQQILITIIVVLVLLRRIRSSAIISAMLPMAVLSSFLLMKWTGVDANIMSLAGIAIAIGTMVDMGIVFTENIIQHLETAPPDKPRSVVIRDAAAEVAPAVLTSTLTTVASFLPVFALTASEGKLFSPLAYTKTFALLGSLAFAMTILPALAHRLLWQKPDPVKTPHTGFGRVWRSLLRFEHARDWLVLVIGVVLAVAFEPWVGAFVIMFAVFRLAEPMLPTRLRGAPRWIENIVAVMAVTYLLAEDWLPLGPGRGLPMNLGFVALVVGVILGAFSLFILVYDKILRWALNNKVAFLSAPVFIVAFGVTAWLGFDATFGWLPQSVKEDGVVRSVAAAFPGFGKEFMPPFDEGSYLYMPTTMPHASLGESLTLLSESDAAIKEIPEVDDVVGKIGRVDSPLDSAPISMVETIITYKAEYRTEPDGTRVRQWRDKIRSADDIWQEILKAAERPGLTSAPELMPIAARIVMLQSGMRAPMGIKVSGPDLETIEKVGLELEQLLKQVPSVRPETVFAERIVGKPYIEIELDRVAIARLGLTINAVQNVIQVGVGGMLLTTTIEGRERYAVRVRYMREERDSVEALGRILVPTGTGTQVPLSALAQLRYERGPQMIKSEDTALVGYVIFDRKQEYAETDAVVEAQRFLDGKIASGELVLPAGCSYSFAGSYQNQIRADQRLALLIPLALSLIFILLYMQFRRTSTTALIYTGVAVAVSGGFGLIWLYNQPWFLDFSVLGVDVRELFQVGTVNMSVAVWVGFIALVGVATDDGVVLATYIKQRIEERPPTTVAAIRAEVLEAGKRRVVPCMMTTATTILALLPVLTSQGRGSDVMVPMALPSLGGMTVELVTLFVVPVLYASVEELTLHVAAWRKRLRETSRAANA